MKQIMAAKAFASTMPEWSSAEGDLGLFFHCFPHNSVNSLHMHLIDMRIRGPSWEVHAHKNLPAQSVLAVLKAELHEALSTTNHVEDARHLSAELIDAKSTLT